MELKTQKKQLIEEVTIDGKDVYMMLDMKSITDFRKKTIELEKSNDIFLILDTIKQVLDKESFELVSHLNIEDLNIIIDLIGKYIKKTYSKKESKFEAV